MKLKKISIAILFLLSLSFYSFQTPISPSIEKEILGLWIKEGFKSGHINYNRSTSYRKDKGGFELHEDHTMTIRQSTGTDNEYISFTGKWSFSERGELKLIHESWKGMVEQRLKIIEVNADMMKVKLVYWENL